MRHPNDFITPKQMVESMMAESRKRVSGMSFDSLRILADPVGATGIGIGGTINACLVMAARERLLEGK